MSTYITTIRRLNLLLLAILATAASVSPATAVERRCFPEAAPAIRACIEGRFAQYWRQHGGLPIFGYPLSELVEQPNADTGTPHLTQYLERHRFEAHPQNNAPYDVLLGRLGAEALEHQGRNWQTFPKAAPSAARYFAQTGHAITHAPFWRYWHGHGLEFDGRPGFSVAESVALFGFPLSEPQLETNASGHTVLTQWFERARFEDHGAQGVRLGLLGAETTTDQRGVDLSQPDTAGEQAPTPSATAPASLHDAARQLFDRTNQRRQAEFGKALFIYRDDLQAIGDRIAQEWTAARKNGGNSRILIERYNQQLGAMSPRAGVIAAVEDAPLEAGCKGIDPHDPIAKAVDPYVVGYNARTLTIGVYGPYSGVCGRAMTVIYVVGY